MKELKKIIIGITIVFCLLMPLKIAQSSEIIAPVPVSDKSVEAKKITEKKKEEGEKYYFFCLHAQSEIGIVHSTSGIITKKNDANPQVALNDIREYGATRYKCDKDRVVVTAFNRID